MARVMVTGASGFIGYHLARRLVERGDEVSCLVRTTSNVERLTSLDVRLVYGDVTDRQSIGDGIAGQEVVYHLAGRTRGLRAEQFFQTNTEGTRHIAEACAAADQPPVLVMVSSLAAAGPSPADRPRTEADPPRPVSNYGRSKLAAEQTARDFADRVPLSIVRPPIVLGEADRSGVDLFRSVVKLHLHPVPTWRTYRHSVIHAADLSELLVLVAERGERIQPEAAGENSEADSEPGLYYAAADEAPTYAELGRMIARCEGRWVFVLPIATPVLRLVAAGGELSGRLRGEAVYLNLDKAREATAGHWTCSPHRARDQLGFQPAAPLQERLRQTLAWYRAEGWL